MANDTTQKGQLFWRKTGWYGRWYAIVDGEKIRITRALGTTNKAVARRKLARLIAEGNPTPEAVTREETFQEAAERIVEQQGAHGMKTSGERLSRLQRYVFEHIGERAVTAVRPDAITDVLSECHKAGLSRQGVIHVRNDISAVLAQLWREEQIPSNPVEKVKLPKNLRVDARPRRILSDAQCAAFFEAPETTEHIYLMALASRCFGGMRTSDLHAWDWTHVDRETWFTSKIYRPKTDDMTGATELVEQRIPEVLRDRLKAWWLSWRKPGETEGPSSGPVFPVMKGKRAGEAQSKRSHARELRHALWMAGVFAPLPGFLEAYAALEDARGHLASAQAEKAYGKLRGLRAEVQTLDDAARALCALQSDTTETKRVDFHSFRRAYNTALARAGVNVQTAMKLAGHRSPNTHMRYVLAVEVLETPEQAIPVFAGRALGVPKLPDSLDVEGTEVPVITERPQRDLNSCYRRERPMS